MFAIFPLLISWHASASCFDDKDGRVYFGPHWTAYYLLASNGDKVLVIKANDGFKAAKPPTADDLNDDGTAFYFLNYDFRFPNRTDNYELEVYSGGGSSSNGVLVQAGAAEESAFDKDHIYKIPLLEERGEGREIGDRLRMALTECLQKTRLAKSYFVKDIASHCEKLGGVPDKDVPFKESFVKQVELASFDGETALTFKYPGKNARAYQCLEKAQAYAQPVNFLSKRAELFSK